MKRKYLSLLFWVGVALTVSVLASGLLTGFSQHLWGVYVRGDPILEMPSSVDLGQREFGETVEAWFSVINRGQSDLVLDEFRSNCACNAVEQLKDGQNFRVDRLRLAPSEQVELVLKMVVRARVGEEILNQVLFRTNDPARPEASFVAEMKIAGGISVSPTSVLFGTVPIGDNVHQILEIRDQAIQPRTIRKVVSSNPNAFAAHLLPQDSNVAASKPKDGFLLGRIEVSLIAHKIGREHGEIQIFLDDEARPPDSVSVSARIAPLVEASPSTIVLPRESNSGPLYSATCICRSTLGKPFTLEVENVPFHISVNLSRQASNPSLQLVRIQWDSHESDTSLPDRNVSVRLRAQVGEEKVLVEIPVRLRAISIK